MLLKEKRMEIDSPQSVINKAKNATSIEDLNSRIRTSEQKIQHDTLPLNEEKQLIHNIKQLKQLREQLSSRKCSQNENQQALEQREQAEERLKTLRKELGNLKDTASKAQTACDEAESKYSVEEKKIKELQAQFRAADDVRQVAYSKFMSLFKEHSQKDLLTEKITGIGKQQRGLCYLDQFHTNLASKQVHSLVTVSGMDEEKVEVQEEPVKAKEELELVREAEEIRREEAEAKLKEQRRLEEMVKAKEARERKQRRDEKSQKREELKARKEAEQKGLKRRGKKRSRKKERRKAASTSTSAACKMMPAASLVWKLAWRKPPQK